MVVSAKDTSLHRQLQALAFIFNHEMNRDQCEALCAVLSGAGWTRAEFDCAVSLIPSIDALCQRISYDRGITPGVFAAARPYKQVMRGRLHEYSVVVSMALEAGKSIDAVAEPVLDESESGETITMWVLK